MQQGPLRRALDLVDREAFEEGAQELRRLRPDPDGREEFEALLGPGRAALWAERTGEALSYGERAMTAARAIGADGPKVRRVLPRPGARATRGGTATSRARSSSEVSRSSAGSRGSAPSSSRCTDRSTDSRTTGPVTTNGGRARQPRRRRRHRRAATRGTRPARGGTRRVRPRDRGPTRRGGDDRNGLRAGLLHGRPS
jgi:hypothetical protein